MLPTHASTVARRLSTSVSAIEIRKLIEKLEIKKIKKNREKNEVEIKLEIHFDSVDGYLPISRRFRRISRVI